ncbi:hypothetical protein ACJX0J_019706, partial [Zea mays]
LEAHKNLEMQQGFLAQVVVVVVTAVIGLTLVSIVGKWKQNILAAIVGTLFPCACARLLLDFAKRTLPHIKKSWHDSPMLILVWLTYVLLLILFFDVNRKEEAEERSIGEQMRGWYWRTREYNFLINVAFKNSCALTTTIVYLSIHNNATS